MKTPHLEYILVKIPLKERRKNAVVILLACSFAISAAGGFKMMWVFIGCIFGVLASLAVFKFKTNERVLTPESKKIVAELEAENFEQALDEKPSKADEFHFSAAWYIRYLIAGIITAGVLWYVDSHAHLIWKDWLVIGIALSYAIALARELAFLGAICLGGYFLFAAVASLPVSAAIIFGAIIIGLAIANRRS